MTFYKRQEKTMEQHFKAIKTQTRERVCTHTHTQNYQPRIHQMSNINIIQKCERIIKACLTQENLREFTIN